MRTISARRKGRVNCACVPAVERYRSSASSVFLSPRLRPGLPDELMSSPPCPPLHAVERGDEGTGEGQCAPGVRPGSVRRLRPCRLAAAKLSFRGAELTHIQTVAALLQPWVARTAMPRRAGARLLPSCCRER